MNNQCVIFGCRNPVALNGKCFAHTDKTVYEEHRRRSNMELSALREYEHTQNDTNFPSTIPDRLEYHSETNTGITFNKIRQGKHVGKIIYNKIYGADKQ